MDLQEIMIDIHALNEELEVYERKYGVLSETFYESYINGEEPEDDAWVLDWADWAGAYKILLRRRKQYRRTMGLCVPSRCSAKTTGYIGYLPNSSHFGFEGFIENLAYFRKFLSRIARLD